ncbi:hypothetical protein C7B63_17610 [Bacillus halotolerans]|nr:hypothetical protein C7B63_17610 [Bacillus halotolerans]PRP57662.1 hypothetical protein C7B66_17625 [Bacillus halotolerans]PRP63181.1 hypothetical protein C7B72_14205 [Bacillus halotolerans]
MNLGVNLHLPYCRIRDFTGDFLDGQMSIFLPQLLIFMVCVSTGRINFKTSPVPPSSLFGYCNMMKGEKGEVT